MDSKEIYIRKTIQDFKQLKEIIDDYLISKFGNALKNNRKIKIVLKKID